MVLLCMYLRQLMTWCGFGCCCCWLRQVGGLQINQQQSSHKHTLTFTQSDWFVGLNCKLRYEFDNHLRFPINCIRVSNTMHRVANDMQHTHTLIQKSTWSLEQFRANCAWLACFAVCCCATVSLITRPSTRVTQTGSARDRDSETKLKRRRRTTQVCYEQLLTMY